MLYMHLGSSESEFSDQLGYSLIFAKIEIEIEFEIEREKERERERERVSE